MTSPKGAGTVRLALAALAIALLALPLALALTAAARAAEAPTATQPAPVDWESWHADNEVTDRASLQRGARDFMNYCEGCHSLKYVRYESMAADLKIPVEVLKANLIPPGASQADYISTPMPSDDALDWFGKVPPDLSLITRYKGVDYVYRYLKTFYTDASSPTLSNNLAFPSAAMPDVLSDLEGVKSAVFRTVKSPDGSTQTEFDHFATTSPGNMTPEQFDQFVRDTVNFLDYVGDPNQIERHSMGIWVVLFLLVLTGFAWLLKREYWKAVH
jgi:ubiquinol-cytochrome c reductase cytochrome c1 subunit